MIKYFTSSVTNKFIVCTVNKDIFQCKRICYNLNVKNIKQILPFNKNFLLEQFDKIGFNYDFLI
jgi:hypothetical protein